MGPRNGASAAVADVAVEALSATSGVHVLQVVADRLAEVLAVDAICVAEHEWSDWSYVRMMSPLEAWEKLPVTEVPTRQLAETHPGVAWVQATRTSDPLVITDVIGEQAWRRSEYAVMSRPNWGRDLQLCIPLQLSPKRASSGPLLETGGIERRIATSPTPCSQCCRW